jgi:two-component system NarL family response regulator
MTDAPIRVLIADSNELLRLGLSSLLQREPGIQVVGVASTISEALFKLVRQRPDVLLIESRMRDSNGLPAVARVLALDACDRVAVIAMSDTDSDLLAAFRLEVQGHILKDSSLAEVVQVVRSAVKSEPYYPRSAHWRKCGLASAAPSAGTARHSVHDGHNGKNEKDGHNGRHGRGKFVLSAREHGVLRLVAAGATNQEIADALGISTNTVKVHLRSILDKLHVRNRQQAAAYAVQEGLAGKVIPEDDRPQDESIAEYKGAFFTQNKYPSH